MGALVSLSLIQLGNKFDSSVNFCVTFSEDLKSMIDPEKHEFILGLLQKSISNKVFKNPSKNKQFKVTFQDALMDKETVNAALAMSDAMSYTRSFINMPPNILNPESYELFLRTIVKNECEKAMQPNRIQIEI